MFMRNHQYHPPDLLGHQEVEPPGSHATDNMVADAPIPLLSSKEKQLVIYSTLNMSRMTIHPVFQPLLFEVL